MLSSASNNDLTVFSVKQRRWDANTMQEHTNSKLVSLHLLSFTPAPDHRHLTTILWKFRLNPIFHPVLYHLNRIDIRKKWWPGYRKDMARMKLSSSSSSLTIWLLFQSNKRNKIPSNIHSSLLLCALLAFRHMTTALLGLLSSLFLLPVSEAVSISLVPDTSSFWYRAFASNTALLPWAPRGYSPDCCQGARRFLTYQRPV